MFRFINKYFSKTNNRLLSIGLGIGGLVFYFIAKVTFSLSIGPIKMYVFLFLIMYLVCALAIGVSIYYSYRLYFKNKDKDINNIITFVVSCFVAVILLLNIQSIIFFFKLSSIDSMFDLFSLADDIDKVTTSLNLLDFAFVVLIGNAIFNGVLYYKQKQNPNDSSDDSTVEQIKSDTNTDAKEPNQIFIKVKEFLSTLKGKVITGSIVAVVILIAIFTSIMGNQKTDIDIMKNVEVSFSGTSGEGYAEIENSSFDYDGDNEKVKDFLNTIYFHVERNNGELKNGDTIKVTALFDEDDATASKVSIKEKSKKFKVKDLDADYTNAKDLPNDQKKKLSKAWDAYFTETIDKDILSKFKYDFKDEPAPIISEKQLLNTYFLNSEYKASDKAVFLIKATASGKKRYSFTEGPEDSVLSKYYIIEVDELTKNKIDKLSSDDFEISYTEMEAKTDDEAFAEIVKIYESDAYSKDELSEIK